MILALNGRKPRVPGRGTEARLFGNRPMTKRSTVLSAAMLSIVALASDAPAQSQSGAQTPPTTTFRSGLDVIAVDVQVIDREGTPVVGLGPDKFVVTINGRRRRV